MFTFIKNNIVQLSTYTSIIGVSSFIIYNKQFDNYSIIKNKSIKKENITKNDLDKFKDDKRIITYYKNNVYDITNFVNNHPGGKDKILLSNYTKLDPFWKIYKQHNKKEIYDILDKYKIGRLDKSIQYDINILNDTIIISNQLLFKSIFHIIHTNSPVNAEPLSDFLSDFYTPNKLWYIRNHHPIPNINIDTYLLQLQFFPYNFKFNYNKLLYFIKKHEYSMDCTLQCGGNRRSEFNRIDKTLGTPWKIGAISNGKWSGIKLNDFLILVSFDFKKNKDKHLLFTGNDSYQISVPVNKIQNSSIMIVNKLNGEDLPIEHGYPFRLLVPGRIGSNSVKWLQKIELSDFESSSNSQSGISYRILPKEIKSIDNLIPKLYKKLEEPSLTSVITTNNLKIGENIIKGYAYTNPNEKIEKVQISLDKGKKWEDCEFVSDITKYTWVQWEYNTDIVIKGEYNLWCRAISNKNKQIDNIDDQWNLRGLNNNSIYKKKFII